MKLKGLAARLFEEIEKMPVVDCHEHLPTEKERVAKDVDALTLFSHYCKADLEAAGLLQGESQKRLFDASRPLDERWTKFKPYLPAIRHGSYAYPAFAYIRDVLGFDDLNDETVGPISERLRADNQPGIYRQIMQDRCGIKTAIQCKEGVGKGDQPFFVYLCRDRSADVYALEALERETGVAIHSLRHLDDAIEKYVEDRHDEGAVGLKVGLAYARTLEIDDVPAAEAERILVAARSKVRSRPSDAEGERLENYVIRREVEACERFHMPVVIHTGYQAGNRNDIRNARATKLWSLLRSYPRARFDLFHGSFPYVSDMTVLGKYFENVSLNMCWMHIMSPEIARRALREWLDAVPVTKIFAFGGDYTVVEKVHGHLKLARMNVAMVLAEKVESEWMTEEEALTVAQFMFHDNPKRWYGI